MLEIPEVVVLSNQIKNTIIGKKIMKVVANQSPHKFAWFYKDKPENYDLLLKNKVIENVIPIGGLIEIVANDARFVFGDGVNVRYYEPNEKIPPKHQLHISFTDGSSLVGSVQMYGGLWAFLEGTFDYPYYFIAKSKPSPLHEDFDITYFKELIKPYEKLSVKAFLATEQRIPGFGNGVLQDILYKSKIHPKRKVETLQDHEVDSLFQSIKTTLNDMIDFGGRNTEKDLFGNKGGYETLMSKNTVGNTCDICGHTIQKQNYLGGSIYFCDGCQPL